MSSPEFDSILSDDFLTNNAFGDEQDIDIEYLLRHTPQKANESFFVPFVQTPATPVSVHSHPDQASTPISAKTDNKPQITTKPLPMAMNNSIATCRQFGGYPHENATDFLEEFESYAVLHNILSGEDARKIAAFHLHLCGPARTWFNSLVSTSKNTWETFKATFTTKYVTVDLRSPTLILESEAFDTLSLSQGQTIDDYYTQVLQKGKLLRKPDHEILIKFIRGLPHGLAFFVRAGHHSDISSALDAAKEGEAYGYRSDETPLVAAVRPKVTKQPYVQNSQSVQPSVVSELQSQINTLTENVSKLTAAFANSGPPKNDAGGNAPVNPPAKREFKPNRNVCVKCSAPNHFARACNWNGEADTLDESYQCRICGQLWHKASQCIQQGNRRGPGLEGREPRGQRK